MPADANWKPGDLARKPVPRRANGPRTKIAVMRRLESLWLANPDLRLGQLVGNVIGNNVLYNVEDLDLIDRLETFYNERLETADGKDQ